MTSTDRVKFQISSIKSQIKSKHEYSMTKSECHYGQLEFVIWCLPGRRQAGLFFGICDLEFTSRPKESRSYSIRS